MGRLRPYTLDEAQRLVQDAKERYKHRHQWFRALEMLYRTGKSQPISDLTAYNTVFERLSPADLETINMVLPHLNIIIASIVSRDPRPVAVPYAGGEVAELSAKVAESVGYYYWLRTGATSVMRDMAQDLVVLGNGFCKVGWTHIESERDKDQLTYDLELADVIEAESMLAQAEGRAELAPFDELAEYVPVTEKIVDEDEPFVEYVSPYDIFFPSNARRIEDCRWIAQRIVLPVDEVKANPMLKNTDDLVTDGSDNRQSELGSQFSNERYAQQVFESATIYEFYDMRTRQLKVFQLGAEKPLFEGDIPFSHRFSPYVHMSNYKDGGNEIWAFGDLENIASLQEKLNEVFTEQVDNMRRSGNKYLTVRGALSSDARDRLESNEPDVVVEVDLPATGQPLSDVIVPVPRASLPSDIYAAQGKMEDAMRQVLGINDFQAGGVGADRMAAYTAAVVDGVATLRAKDKVASVEKAAGRVFNIIIRLCQEFMTDSKPVRILGPNGAMWADVDAEMLYGEYDMRVEGGSLEAANPATRQGRAIELLNMVVPTLSNYGYNPEPALRHAIRELGYDPDHLLKKEPQPEAAPAEPAMEDLGMSGELPMLASGLPPEMGAPTGGLEQALGLPVEQGSLASLSELGGF
jgi:hypothetical protein